MLPCFGRGRPDTEWSREVARSLHSPAQGRRRKRAVTGPLATSVQPHLFSPSSPANTHKQPQPDTSGMRMESHHPPHATQASQRASARALAAAGPLSRCSGMVCSFCLVSVFFEELLGSGSAPRTFPSRVEIQARGTFKVLSARTYPKQRAVGAAGTGRG